MNQSHQFDPSILREYDIRGIISETLNPRDALAVGQAFGTMVRRADGLTVGICYDGRHSSPALAKALIDGLTSTGLSVENYGLGPTPMAYFGMKERGLDAAVIITGSHNPPNYNGIKMVMKDSPVYGAKIQEIGAIAASGDFLSGPGEVHRVDIYADYIDRLVADYDPQGQPPLKIAWDAGNGAAGAILQRLTDQLPGEHILLYETVDGDFPNHHPDPAVEENLDALKNAVLNNNCDVGIAFDGDADRIGAVDSTGTMIWGDQLVGLYAKELLSRVKGAQVLMDVKCSQTIFDKVTEWGGKPQIYKTGHSVMKAKMAEIDAELGGELSGHIYIKDGFYGHDDALYCAIRLMNVIHKFGRLGNILNEFPTVYNTPEFRFDVDEEKKFSYIDKVADILSQDKDADVLTVDGVRVTTKDGWFLIRASNTQNALSIRAESTSKNGLKDIMGTVVDLLKTVKAPVPDEMKEYL